MAFVQNIKKNWLHYFVYISVAFLAYTLIKKEYIVLPETINYKYFSLSFFVLFAGVFVQGLSYKVILKNFGYYITARDSLIAFGMTVLSRYVPGKFWVHLGRAGYIRDHYNYPYNELAFISLNSLFIGIWIVVLFCSLGFVIINIPFLIKIIIVVFWLILTLIIFTRYFHRIAQWLVLKISGREIKIPNLSFKENLNVFPVIIAYWFLYAFAFHLLALSFYADVGYLSLMYFPISAIVGIAAIFAPGGLGAREATLAGFLTLGGTTAVLATTIAVFSRIWFLAGELFGFVLGIVIRLSKK